MKTFVTIQGASQGEITRGAGDAKSVANLLQSGHEDESQVPAYLSEITASEGPGGGDIVLSFSTPFDNATPLLLKALHSREQLTLTFRLHRTSTRGEEEHYFTLVYDGVILNSIKPHLPTQFLPDNETLPDLIDVQCRALNLTATHEIAGNVGDFNALPDRE